MALLSNGRANSRFTESYEFYSSDFTRFSSMSGSQQTEKRNPSQDVILDALEDLQEMPKILGEGILLTGGAVAMLLQAAAHGMPESTKATTTAVNGTAKGESKLLSEQLYQNLHTTVIYLHGLTFGTRDQRRQILDRIQSHEQNGQPQQNGTNGHDQYTYPQDPNLRLWIAATLYATATEVYQRVFEKLNYQRAERAYHEYSVLITALDLPKGTWPQNRGAFWAYWDESIELLDVDPRARPVVQDLKQLHDLPGWLKLSKPFIKNVTPEMLPPHVREQYGFESSPTSRLKYRLYMGGARAIYPALPSAIRCLPKKRAMRQVEEMLQKK